MAEKEIDEILREAAAAVSRARVPDDLRPVAFKEAVDFLRGRDGERSGDRATDVAGAQHKSRDKAAPRRRERNEGDPTPPDEATFFSSLAHESGASESDLKDILQVTKDRKVHITAATKTLGKSRAEQAKTVIALVGGARAIGLGESPVNAEAVREEAKRKHCFDQNNFAGKSLTPMKGFNAGSNKNEIVLTSKWVGDFTAAVDKAHGRSPAKAGAKSD